MLFCEFHGKICTDFMWVGVCLSFLLVSMGAYVRSASFLFIFRPLHRDKGIMLS